MEPNPFAVQQATVAGGPFQNGEVAVDNGIFFRHQPLNPLNPKIESVSPQLSTMPSRAGFIYTQPASVKFKRGDIVAVNCDQKLCEPFLYAFVKDVFLLFLMYLTLCLFSQLYIYYILYLMYIVFLCFYFF